MDTKSCVCETVLVPRRKLLCSKVLLNPLNWAMIRCACAEHFLFNLARSLSIKIIDWCQESCEGNRIQYKIQIGYQLLIRSVQSIGNEVRYQHLKLLREKLRGTVDLFDMSLHRL